MKKYILVIVPFIFIFHYHTFGQAKDNGTRTHEEMTLRARPLDLSSVRLVGGPLKQAQDLDAKYLLELEPDRMLAYYRQRAGLQPKAKPYGGWDGGGRNLTGHIDGRTAETCNVYNMLKLTRRLFSLRPDALHADGIYYESGDKLWVNLYAPSTAEWTTAGVNLEMDTDFPEGESATLKFTLDSPKEFVLALRRPAWAGEGFNIKVNGQPVSEDVIEPLRNVPASGGSVTWSSFGFTVFIGAPTQCTGTCLPSPNGRRKRPSMPLSKNV